MRRSDELPPGRGMARERFTRVRATVRAAPLPVKIVLVLALLAAAVVASALPVRVGDLLLVAAGCYGPVAVWRRQRSVFASLGVAAWGLGVILSVAALTLPLTIIPLLLLPFVVVAAAHVPVLARSFVPCRTVAWTLLWAVPAAMLAWRLASAQPAISYLTGFLVALVVLGWRLARTWQDGRGYSSHRARSAVTSPYAQPAGWRGPGRP